MSQLTIEEFLEKYKGMWLCYLGRSVSPSKLSGETDFHGPKFCKNTWFLVKGAAPRENCLVVSTKEIGDFIVHITLLNNIQDAPEARDIPEISRPQAPWKL